MITQAELKQRVRYHKDTGLFTWRDGVAYVEKGAIVGSLRPDGYIGTTIMQEKYLLHRLAFLYMEGFIPEEIDHIDKEPANNKWTNLRACSRKENSLNKEVYSNNKLGVKGVTKNKRGEYCVRITAQGEYKHFGCFPDLELAELVAIEVRDKYHGSFCRH